MDDWAKIAAMAKEKWTQGQQQGLDYVLALPPSVHVLGAFVAGICVGLLLPKLRQPFRRFVTVDDIPMQYF